VIPLRGTPAQRQAAAQKKPLDDGEWLWQEWIAGQALCTYSLCNEGEVLAHAAYRTPYTVGIGAGIFYAAVSSPAYTKSLEVAQKLAEAAGYTGSLSLDLIEEHTGRLVLIEVNPRATMGLALLAHQPAFAACWRALVCGSTAPEQVLPGTGRRQLKAAMLLLGRKRRWRDVLTTPDVLTDPSDPGPARAALGIYLSYARQARAQKLSTTAFSTFDIEWNGEQP
jgi:hypothetical protein